MLKCINCSKEFDIELKTAKKVICHYCGYRILKKPRPKTPKKVMAN